MVKKILIGIGTSILLAGCSTPPYYSVWNMSTSPDKPLLEKKTKTSHLYKAFSQEPSIKVSNKVSRYISKSDVETSIVLSLIHYNLYSYDSSGKYTLVIEVKSMDVRGGESFYQSSEEFQSIPDDVKVELEISYLVTSNKTEEIIFERAIKTKHQDKIHDTDKTRDIIVEDIFARNYDLFIQNFIKENL